MNILCTSIAKIDPMITTMTAAPTVPITLLEVRLSPADIFLIMYDVSNDFSRINFFLTSLINSCISSSVLMIYEVESHVQLQLEVFANAVLSVYPVVTMLLVVASEVTDLPPLFFIVVIRTLLWLSEDVSALLFILSVEICWMSLVRPVETTSEFLVLPVETTSELLVVETTSVLLVLPVEISKVLLVLVVIVSSVLIVASVVVWVVSLVTSADVVSSPELDVAGRPLVVELVSNVSNVVDISGSQGTALELDIPCKVRFNSTEKINYTCLSHLISTYSPI